MTLTHAALGSMLTVLLTLPGFAQEKQVYTFDDLSQRCFEDLVAIYRAAQPGPLPQGFLKGRTVFREHDFLAGPRSKVTNFAWQGKHFAGDGLVNQFRFGRLIRANIYLGESWLDGQQAHILDYQHASFLWNDVRDEMREASPGVYVGAMYLRRACGGYHKVMFVLQVEGC